MTDKKTGLGLSAKEIAESFRNSEWSTAFPPILTVDQAAHLAQVPKATVYDWSSRGLLHGCAKRVGKHLRIVRDRFVSQLFNEGIQSSEKTN